MPHRRRMQKGSFGSHLDDLVKHFPNPLQAQAKTQRPKHNEDQGSIHDKLFEGAWRERRERRRNSL